MARIVTQAERYRYQSSHKVNDDYMRRIIHASMPEMNNFQIMNVENNKFLHAAFLIKKSELLTNYGRDACETEILIHATSKHNVESILKDNLDWRYVRRAKYGIGVSFSHDSKYANKYCNNRNGTARAFIICEVLIGKAWRINDNSDIYPRNGAHTYKTRNNLVIVKFDDFTFYPVRVIFYSTMPDSLTSPLPLSVQKQAFNTVHSSTMLKVSQKAVDSKPDAIKDAYRTNQVSAAWPSAQTQISRPPTNVSRNLYSPSPRSSIPQHQSSSNSFCNIL